MNRSVFIWKTGVTSACRLRFTRHWRWPRHRSADDLKSTARPSIGRTWTRTSESRACWQGRGSIITMREKPLNAPFVSDDYLKRLWRKNQALRCNRLDQCPKARPPKHRCGKSAEPLKTLRMPARLSAPNAPTLTNHASRGRRLKKNCSWIKCDSKIRAKRKKVQGAGEEVEVAA
jgi:hypothetical protein